MRYVVTVWAFLLIGVTLQASGQQPGNVTRQDIASIKTWVLETGFPSTVSANLVQALGIGTQDLSSKQKVFRIPSDDNARYGFSMANTPEGRIALTSWRTETHMYSWRIDDNGAVMAVMYADSNGIKVMPKETAHDLFVKVLNFFVAKAQGL
jgi:hypothetical protein